MGKFGAKSIRDVRKQLAERDGVNCYICGNPMNFESLRRKTGATIDHVIPKSKGGSNKLSNLRLAHRRCNEAKADKLIGEL